MGLPFSFQQSVNLIGPYLGNIALTKSDVHFLRFFSWDQEGNFQIIIDTYIRWWNIFS